MTSFQSSPVRIWKTVSMATEKESKLVGGMPSGKLKVPPKSCMTVTIVITWSQLSQVVTFVTCCHTCMPRRAAIRMKRKSSSSSEMIDFIEETSDTSRLRRDDQYLQGERDNKIHAEILL